MSNRRSRNRRIDSALGRTLRYIGLLAGIVIGWQAGLAMADDSAGSNRDSYALLLAVTLGALFFLISPYVTLEFFSWLRREIRRLTAADLIVVVTGLIVGGVVSALLAWPLSLLPDPFGQVLPSVTAVIICGLAVVAFVTMKPDLLNLVPRGAKLQPQEPDAPSREIVLLDTSAIIDGRIVEFAQSGFLMADLLVPEFVIRELQLVADSAEPGKRSRGRRGLEVLDRLKRDVDIEMHFTDSDAPDERDVDNKLVRLARDHDYRILTGDQNLERIAGLHEVRVLNIHSLSNLLRPPVTPGEGMLLRIVQPGREYDQGVGFLDDGTMVVVESGKNLIGQDAEVVITRTLQTAAGRMAFAQLASDRGLAS